MKKVFAVILAVVMTCGLFGCGEAKVNDQLSDEAASALKAAIETLDAFLDYDITAEKARDKLERIESSLGSSDLYDSIVATSIYNAAANLGIYARYESFGSSPDDYNGMKDIRESRENLYDLLYDK